jgi:hypothetical protein
MTELGEKWCNVSETMAFGYEGQVWYYDGARVYFQIADYTGDPKWEKCAWNIARQSRDFVTQAGGHIQGWRVFPHGLRMAYERSKDESYRKALLLLAKNSAFASQGGGVSDELIRETAYVVEAYVNAEKAGAPRDPLMAQAVDYLLGHFDSLFVSNTYQIHQTFYDGLGAEALIEYYELTGDPRIPPAIKAMCDWIYEKGWDRRRKELLYNPDPKGPRCASGCQEYGTDLINLVVPAFGWLYRYTGDPVYQRRGDELFDHALDQDPNYSGKIFSQNYRWSIQYVIWRLGEDATPAARRRKK